MEEKIKGILSSIKPEFDFNNVQDFIETGMLDSFDIVSLIANLEITFDIRIDGEDVIPENFVSVNSIAALLGKYGVH